MAKTLKDLPIGANVWITEGEKKVLYEVAAFNIHAEESATMVRKEYTEDTISLTSYLYFKPYVDSELDFAMKSFEGRYDVKHRAALIDADIQYKENVGIITETKRKVFALSATEVSGEGTWGTENRQLELYYLQENRIKGHGIWGLRSRKIDYFSEQYVQTVYAYVNENGETKEDNNPVLHLAPSFVIDSSTEVSDIETNGGYEIYFRDSEAIAQPIYPAYISIDPKMKNEFRWSHNSNYGSQQTRAELQIRSDVSDWRELATVYGEETSVEIQPETISGGRYAWRVRGYNEDKIAGPWSKEVWFIAQAAPRNPSVTIEGNSPRPTIKWQVDGQSAFQVEVGDYDSGILYGENKKYKIPIFLPDGIVKARVRVQNTLGLWSEWGEATSIVSNMPPGNIFLTAGTENQMAVLSWDGFQGAVYYVQRDGVPIAKTVDTAYTDQMTVGPHNYTVMGVGENDNYAVSNSVYHETTVRGALIASMNGKEWVKMKCRRGGRPTHRRSITPVVAYHHYAGRTLPVADISPYKTVGDTFSFTVLDKETRKALEMLAGKLVIYKDEQGVVVGVLDRISVDVRRKSDFDFDITQTEWSEEIEYSV